MKEAKGTAPSGAVKERRDAWGQGQERKEENDRVEIDLFERGKRPGQKKKKKRRGRGRGKKGPAFPRRRCTENKQTRKEGIAGES